MDNLEQMLNKTKDIQQFTKDYFNYLSELLNRIDRSAIAAFAEEMEKARQEHSTIFVIGNGGSTATAAHMANDFSALIRKETKSDMPFRVLSLTDNTPAMLAIANDDGYENLFVNQLQVYYKPGDRLVAISASGNSPNIIHAVKWVRNQGGVVMSLVGFDGGRLKELSDIVIHVKTMKGEYGPVEDIHLIMGHLISGWLRYRIQNEK